MSVWFASLDLKAINQRGGNTMVDYLGVRFIEITDESLSATMPVNERTRQPIGIMHGGANVVLAETVASTAANMVVDISKEYCVGLEINANHIRSVRDGIVTAVGKPIHLGRSTQIWEIKIYNEQDKITCISRMTASVLQRA